MDLSAERSVAVMDENTSSVAHPAGSERRFPTTFNIYYTKTKSTKTSILHLGEHQSHPLYAATSHVGWSGRSNLTLHVGPSTDSPALATADSESRANMNTVIKIPAPSAGGAFSERLRVECHLAGLSHHFSVPSMAGNNALPERFEWRQSRRGGSWGWKLVRITSNATCGTAEGPDSKAGEVAGDGKEVVARLVDSTALSSKVAKFEFLGSGVAGELGDDWSIMAVLSALRLWQMRYFLRSA
jgi:hypothetical protein